MGPKDGTDSAQRNTPVPIDGDGEELLGMVIDGRYRLDATLGRGGMGLVYRAAHIGLRRQVAVKILHPSLAASPEVRNRFEREAIAVGKIDHPNCVSVYDVGRLPDGSLYLAMELLEGKALADILEHEGQIAPGRALHILAGILRGLSHIHAHGLIHRDIKPENIFLIRQGEDEDFVKILDFGIAKGIKANDLDDGVRLTQAGMAFGTPIYMAPEQALGNPMDGRADLYTASVLAYEMLCGAPPFYSDDKLEVMSMHTARPVPPMRQRMMKGGRPVPSTIERLIIRGLTKKPAERYPTADIYLAEVEAALATQDGGATDVNFPRVGGVEATGSQPLISDDGEVRLPHPFAAEVASANISSAIDDILASPLVPRVVTPPKGVPPTLPAGDRFDAPGLGAMGGVGLGLPYTGPAGEPIFGLTPEQRLRASDPAFTAGTDSGVANALEPDRSDTTLRRKQPTDTRWPLYAGVAGMAAIAGVVIAIVTSPRGPDRLDPSTPAGAANEALKRGDPAGAIKLLEANKQRIARDPMAQLMLGHAYAARNDSEPSLVAYELALTLEPGLEKNLMLRTDLKTMAGSKNPPPLVLAKAFDLWVGRTKDPEAKPSLLKAAKADDLERRHAVRPVIAQQRLEAEVDWMIAYSLDLDQEPVCEKRQEAVAKLRALNDRRAVGALERAVIRKHQKGSWRGKPYNPCLIDDGKAAIGYLKGLPKK